MRRFKGRKLTVRDWDLQLRQPILLADGRVVVSVSPQEGFLHQYSELDTLGIDRPETKVQPQMTIGEIRPMWPRLMLGADACRSR